MNISIEDCIVWQRLDGEELNHPTMEFPGVRLQCDFYLALAKGHLQMDLAFGDEVEGKKIPLERIKYKNNPFFGPNFKIFSYPPETIFAEKLQIAVSKRGQNTRMKDYYDLYKLSGSSLIDNKLLTKSIKKTFKKRNVKLISKIEFDSKDLERLQQYWAAFLRKIKIQNAPANIIDVIYDINKKLEELDSL